MLRLEKLLLFGNLLLYGFLAIFSYAYVDLNLTLSQNHLALNFVGFMQQLGYYHRPQASLIYITFVIAAFTFFVANLYFFHRGAVGIKYLKIATIANTLILVLAYPFLSSDLFNYLFDAKIVTHYHLSPYDYRAMDFPQDDWIRFMRWIHRYSPYGPAWLGLSAVPSILGFGKFLLTLFTFKIFIAAFHIINARIIYKTLQKVDPKMAIAGTAFYSLNPLFLIEGVANAHNDVVVATFLLLPIYFSVVKQKAVLSYAAIAAGVLIKYISILNLPWFILRDLFKKPKSFKTFIILNILTMGLFTILYSNTRLTVPFISAGSTQVQFQPWYLFWTIPLLALIPKVPFLTIAIGLSLGASLRYLPFIYFGDWSQPGTIQYMKLVTVIPFAVSTVFILFYTQIKKYRKPHTL
ncbi:MAG: hypothetical protein WD988_00980 [Candidatus Curtissbacteria bacterium]